MSATTPRKWKATGGTHTETVQHVAMERKLAIRRKLLDAYAMPGAVYVPFIGDGDIAAELYRDRVIFGADLAADRVARASERLQPNAGQIIVADCDAWPPFAGQLPVFAVADFDAYSYPFDAFRAWWQNAPKTSRVVVFGTESLMVVHRRVRGTVRLPNGERIAPAEMPLNATRALTNFWWTRQVLPWLEGLGWRVVDTVKYKRGKGDMLYWGAVLEQPTNQGSPT